MSANDRTGVGVGSAEWGTPPDLFATLRRRYAFDYDAFASHGNRLLSRYSTIDGTFDALLGAEYGKPPIKISDATGLEYDWTDRRVYMNPPYSRGLIEQCIEKAWSERERASLIVALVPAATETRWFQRWILPYCFVEYLPRRVHYIDPETGIPGGSPPSGSVVAMFRSELMR